MDRISLVFGWRGKVGIGGRRGEKKGKKNHSSFRVATDGRNRAPLHPFPPTVISSDQPSGEKGFFLVV